MASASARFARHLRGFFGGSGSDCLSDLDVCRQIVKLSGKELPNVLYLGTATYDSEPARLRQTSRFAEMGCTVSALEVAHQSKSIEEIKTAFDAADVVVVSGGNTLFAVDRWNLLGISDVLRQQADRLVLSGGSAGAIIAFQGGHSDSGDPTTFRQPMSPEEPLAKQWQYIRVDGLGLLPGLLCPHHDKVQSNGVLRAIDLDQMLLRHRSERAICIDHCAALVVNGGDYAVYQMIGQPGSVAPDHTFVEDRSGVPGIWIKEVDEASGHVRCWLAPASGKLSELLREPHANQIIDDERVAAIRAANSANF